MSIFDVGIIGAGMAGSFAAYRLVQEHKDMKVILFDTGRPPMKRRAQMQGFLGLLPNSDGKLYLPNLPQVSALVGSRQANASFKLFKSILSNVCELKVIKDRTPISSLEKKIKKAGYEIQLNNYMQLYPNDIHILSKSMAEKFDGKNITFSFDNEVFGITKQKGIFSIRTENQQEFKCKKIILCTGRSGWRWASELYNNFGIIEENDTARFGIRIEMPASNLKDFNKSCFSLRKEGKIEIGPFCWGGTVIPEDHIDLVVSAFRSNENRWRSDKVSFQFIGNINMPEQGYQQTDRIGKLAFILSDDRVIKEKVSLLMGSRSKISIIPEYDWIKKDLSELSEIIPDVLNKAYFYIPTIIPLPPKINIGSNLETEIDGLFVAGENAGLIGLLSAGLTGLAAANAVCK